LQCFALNSSGNVVWRSTGDGGVYSSPVIVDVNKDGVLDVIYGSKFDQKLYVLRGDTGAKIWSYTLSHQIDASPAVADVDGDGVMDIVLGDKNGKVYALSGPEA